MSLTHERLREVLAYDPATGIFVWRMGRGRIAAGSVAGSVGPDGYRRICVDYDFYQAHRLAWFYMTGEWPKTREVDHKDLNRDNNRWGNLREATNAQNKANEGLRVTNTSGFRGVSWHRATEKWRAQITVAGQTRYLGQFPSPEEAAVAYQAAARAAFGDFVRF